MHYDNDGAALGSAAVVPPDSDAVGADRSELALHQFTTLFASRLDTPKRRFVEEWNPEL